MAAQHVASATWAYATAVTAPGGSGAVRKGRAAGSRQGAGPEAGWAAAEVLQRHSAALLAAVARGLGAGAWGARRRGREGTGGDVRVRDGEGRQLLGQRGGMVEGEEVQEGEDELLAARLAGGEGRKAQVGVLGRCMQGGEQGRCNSC